MQKITPYTECEDRWEKKNRQNSDESCRFLVPVTGVEPVRYRYHWILSCYYNLPVGGSWCLLKEDKAPQPIEIISFFSSADLGKVRKSRLCGHSPIFRFKKEFGGLLEVCERSVMLTKNLPPMKIIIKELNEYVKKRIREFI